MLKMENILVIISFIFAITFILSSGLFSCHVSYQNEMIGYILFLLSFSFLMIRTISNELGNPFYDLKQFFWILLPSVINILVVIFLIKSIYLKRLQIKNKRCSRIFYSTHSYYKLIFVALMLIKIYQYLNDNLNLLHRMTWILTLSNAILSIFVQYYLNTS
jgi:hypothetical protein